MDVVLGVLVDLVIAGYVDGGDECVNGLRPELNGAVAKVSVKDLTAAHTDVLVRLEGVPDVDLHVGGGDHLHLPDLPVDDGLGEVELPYHAEGNGTSAGLGIVKLTLEHDGLDVGLLGKDLSSASATRSST